jgi:gamma-glutamyltranspeptidase/glutathione hydrolase
MAKHDAQCDTLQFAGGARADPSAARHKLMRLRGVAVVALALLMLWWSGLAAADVLPRNNAVASAHRLATAAGLGVLDAGGNAFDAAVAVAAVLAVVEPYGSGLGGGGFWLLHRESDGKQVMIDGRERAPLEARRDMYLDEHGDLVPRAAIDGPLAAAIPGHPAALVHIAERYGRLPLARSLAPAIRLAREGFAVDARYHRLAAFRADALRAYPAAADTFLVERAPPTAGFVLVQSELAATLQHLAKHGFDGFYRGEVAEALVRGVLRDGGIWRLEDLASYRVVEREPVYGRYGDLRIVSAAPPSSGGVALVEMLNMLSGHQLQTLAPADRVHYLVEVMRRAYRDRAQYLGDPDFVAVPIARLTSPEYARRLAADIRAERATPSQAAAQPKRAAGQNTTHFSIIDKEGNRVAATLSINYPFGSGFMPEGTGVLLNDEMDDFSAKPGVPNVYGLVGGEANAIAPGKRPLSSMTPTFIEAPDRVAILGTPGGSRIISMVLLGVLEFADGAEPQQWVSRPRFHHQYLPDEIQFEPGVFDDATQQALRAKGHRLAPQREPWGNMQAVLWRRTDGGVSVASDPRGMAER